MGHSPAHQETPQHDASAARTCPKCGQVIDWALDRCPRDGAPPSSAEAVVRVGTHVGNYEIKGILGENETGVVYRGRHVASDRPVVIKILHERSARQKDVVDKFIGEAKAASSIRHTNLVEVADLGTAPDGTVFLVMEYLEGESLRSRLHRVQRLPLFEAINIVRQVARGLGAAHEAGITHGGLNPSDIFLCRRTGRRRIVHRSKAHGMRLVVEPEESFDLVKLLDFGMAKFLDLAPGAPVPADTVSGTFRYLSPEQAHGQAADPRSDIYALGAVFYEMVTGAVPFGGESLVEIVEAQTSGQVIAPSRCNPEAGINGRIEILILRCLKKNPSQRFASTGELCEALDACVTDCAFLRDAHRLPGIMESGIDLSEASPQVRQDPARATSKSAVPPLPQKPPAIPKAKVSARTPMATERAAAVSAPPSAVAVRPEDPSAAASTLPPAGGAADLPAQIPAWEDNPSSLLTLVPPEAIVPDMDEPPERFDLAAGSRRPQAIALAVVLLLGGVGIAVWAARSGLASKTAKSALAAAKAPAPTPVPSPLAAAPVIAPAATAAPAPTPAPLPSVAAPVIAPAATAAPAPAPAPAPLAAAPVVAPAAPAVADPAAALPETEPAEPAEKAKATVRAPIKVASSQIAAQASRARRMARGNPIPPETTPVPEAAAATAPAAKPQPEPSAPSAAIAEPKPAPPPAPADVDNLVREAQHAWMAGSYALAIGKARTALKSEPKHAQVVQAYEIIATSYCATGQAAAAREAAAHLSTTERELVKTMCKETGVTID